MILKSTISSYILVKFAYQMLRLLDFMWFSVTVYAVKFYP